VDQIARVQTLQAKQNLIDDILLLELIELDRGDHIEQVRLHVLEGDVKILVVLAFMDIYDLDNVRVVQLLQAHNLSEGPLRIGRVLERVKDFLQSHGTLGELFLDFPNDAIRSLADLLDDGILLQNMRVDDCRH